MECKKKVVQEDYGYRCENCQRTYNQCKPTYTVTCQISDSTSSMYVKILGEEADKLIGISAQQLMDLQNEGENEQELDDMIQVNKFKEFNFTLRSKIDNY